MSTVLLNLTSQPAGTPSGVARFGIELARRLVATGTHDYVFRSQWPASMLPDEIASGARVEVVPPFGNFVKQLALDDLKAPFRYPASRVDLVFNLDALGLATGGGRRLTIVHDIYFRSLPSMYSRFARAKAQAIHGAIIARSDVVVGISDATANEVRRHFPGSASKVRTVLSDSTMDAVTPGVLPAGLTPKGYVLAVANVTSNKNFGVLADAFARMAGDHPDLKLVHVGGDADELFRNRLAAAGLEDRLVRLRGIDDGTLAAVYAGALVLVVPSLFEGFCLPIVEAQRLGCPVAFSYTSATGEIGGQGGVRFDPTDVDGLEWILRGVATDDGMRADMIARGRENARRFSWERTAAGYEDAMADALGHRVADLAAE